ncbi:hypothetical protein D3C74_286890 [compost metagenome]
MRRNRIPWISPAIDANARTTRRQVKADFARRWHKVAGRILGVDPALDRPAIQLNVLLSEGKRIPLGHGNHLLDQIDAGNHFGDRMLHLNPCIHFHEIKLSVQPKQEFQRSRTGIVDGLRGSNRSLAHFPPFLRRKHRARCLFDQLLPTALYGTVAFA